MELENPEAYRIAHRCFPRRNRSPQTQLKRSRLESLTISAKESNLEIRPLSTYANPRTCTPINPVRERNLSLSPVSTDATPIKDIKITAKINSLTDKQKEKYKIKTYSPLLQRFSQYVESNLVNFTLRPFDHSEPVMVQKIKPKTLEMTKLEPLKHAKKERVNRSPFGKYVKRRNRTTIH